MHAERLEQGLFLVGVECDAGVLGERVGELLEPRVGVQAAFSGLGEHLVLVEPEPGRVREQVTDRGALRTRGGVQLHRALFQRDQGGVGGEQFGDRGEGEHPGGVAMGARTVPSAFTTAAAALSTGHCSISRTLSMLPL